MENPQPSKPNTDLSHFETIRNARINKKKTAAKRMGVKSVFACENHTLAITGFNNTHRFETNILFSSQNGENENAPIYTDRFTINHIGKEIELSNNDLVSVLGNPAELKGEDYLRFKGVLEKEFFGQSFPDNNIYIQIIYNILDIQKLLGLYINNIVCPLNHIAADSYLKCNPNESATFSDEYEDILGKSLKNDAAAKKILYRLQPVMGLYNGVFVIDNSQSNINNKTARQKVNLSAAEKENINILRNLSAIRNWTVHSDICFNNLFTHSALKSIFFRDKEGDWDVIKNIFIKDIVRIYQNFGQYSKLNLNILFIILKLTQAEEQKKLVQDYFDFCIFKKHRNSGISISKVRNFIIEKYYSQILGRICDTHRAKIYVITDYLIYRELQKSSVVIPDTIERLRTCRSVEEKDAVYIELSTKLWKDLQSLLIPFYKDSCNENPPYFNTSYFNKFPPLKAIPDDWFNKVKLNGDRDSILPFVMLLSFLCKFLENKEINEFLTALINKFNNIQTLIDTLIQLNNTVTFQEKYNIFNSIDNRYSGIVSQQLRVLCSCSKLAPNLFVAKGPLYFMAVQMLGFSFPESELNQWIDDNILYNKFQRFQDNNSKHSSKKDPKPVQHKYFIRNFIAKNVIGSRHFFYLTRYLNSRAIRVIMNNPKVVYYALSRLPEKQFNQYADRLGIKTNAESREVIIKRIAEQLASLSIEGVLKDKANSIPNSKDGDKKAKQLVEQIHLYLTIAYIIVKNLIKINARYLIAFQTLERDINIAEKMDKSGIRSFYVDYGGKKKNKYLALIKYYLNKEKQLDYPLEKDKPFDKDSFYAHLKSIKKLRHFTKQWRNIFESNLTQLSSINQTGYLTTFVRNKTAHMDILDRIPDFIGEFRKNSPEKMQSYYELYHYIMQSICLEEKELHLDCYLDTIRNKGIPDKNLIRISYTPFGYNLPRYKNLTNEALFDENSDSGQIRILNNCKKETMNQIINAIYIKKSDSEIEELKRRYIELFDSDEDFKNAVRKAFFRRFIIEAKEKGKIQHSIDDTIIKTMKYMNFTTEEINQVQAAYYSSQKRDEK